MDNFEIRLKTYTEQQVVLGNGYKVHLTAANEFPEFSEWFKCSKDNFGNFRKMKSWVEKLTGKEWN